MAAYYCDFAAGNDTTGDGSAGNPWKTITKASASRSAGDEVRCAKSPADTALTGTLAFTRGSATVEGTSTSFTTELAVADFIKGGDGEWYEVLTITDNDTLVLYQKYAGDNAATVSSYKMGYTDTGQAAQISTQVQVVSTTKVIISGGWDLSTSTKTGITNFRQTHGTITLRYGQGLYALVKDFTLENIGFFRYSYGIIATSSTGPGPGGASLTDCYFGGCGTSGIYLTSGLGYVGPTNPWTLNNVHAVCNSTGVTLTPGNAFPATLQDCHFDANGGSTGLKIGGTSTSKNGKTYKILVDNCTARNCGYGFYLNACDNSTFSNLDASNCTMPFHTQTTSSGVEVRDSIFTGSTNAGGRFNLVNSRVINCDFSGSTATAVYPIGVNLLFEGCDFTDSVTSCDLVFTNHNTTFLNCDFEGSTTVLTTPQLVSEVFFKNCSFTGSDIPKVPVTGNYSLVSKNYSRLSFENYNNTADDHRIIVGGNGTGSIVSETNDRAGGSGLKWKFTIVNPDGGTLALEENPLAMTLAEIPVSSGSEVTVSVYCKKDHATNVAAKLFCELGQLTGITTDVEDVKANDTDWEQLSIQFTPTRTGVVEVKAKAWYVSGLGSVYFADLSVTQA